jgi:hypothetical protein
LIAPLRLYLAATGLPLARLNAVTGWGFAFDRVCSPA